MELTLPPTAPTAPEPPPGYWAQPWEAGLLELHADTQLRAFAGGIDTEVFPSLATGGGCRRLMRAIVERPGFVPGATWLIRHGAEACGTIQGLRDRDGHGAIQNLGVVPEHRGRGLAAVLFGMAAAGFHAAGLRKIVLEVTAQNRPAVRLYRRLGFRAVRTVYKTVEPPVESTRSPP